MTVIPKLGWAILAYSWIACVGAPAAPSTLQSGTQRVAIVNGKLSSAASNYAVNEKGVDGRWVGQQILLYDPARPGEVAEVGRFDYGPDDPAYDFEQMQVRDIAYHAAMGLWGVFIDTGLQDEWYLGAISVPSWTATGQALPVRLYALATGDPMYAADEVRGLGACGDKLLAATPAVGAFPGSLYELAGPWPPVGLAPDAYYLAESRGQLRYDFPDNWGASGDVLCEGGRGFALLAPGQGAGKVRTADLGEAGAGPVAWTGDEVPVDPVDLLETFAVVGGESLAISLEGRVYRRQAATGALTLYDDLGPALPPDEHGQSTRRLRGGATVDVL
jgi:hypothetical protein